MAKKDQSYTVMIVPNPIAKTYRFSVRRSTLKWVAGAASVFAAAVFFLLIHYLLILGNGRELSQLRQETQVQKVQLQTFAQTVADLNQQMVRLKEFDAKLRFIADIGPREEEARPLAMGGTREMSLEEMLTSPDVSEEELSETIGQGLAILEGQAERQELSFQELEVAMKNKKVKWASTPSIWPVRGWLTSGFGKRVSPFTGMVGMHKGIDIATRHGAPVVSPASGTVTYVGYHNGLGKMIKIDHGYGIGTLYGHLSKYNIKRGSRVDRGDVIGYVGNTGLSTGPHLHYEVIVNRVPVNPRRYILN